MMRHATRRGGAGRPRWLGKARGLSVLVPALVLAATAHGQLTLEMRMEHQKVFQFEPVRALLTIRNEGTLPYVIYRPEEPGESRIDLLVERRHYEGVRKIGKGPIVESLEIYPDATEDLLLDLSRWYDFSGMGGYNVSVIAFWRDSRFVSNTMRIEVDGGLPLVSVTKPFPGTVGRFCTFSLRYAMRDRKEHLFLRVDEEATSTNYGAFDLGSLVRVFKPTLEVDRMGAVTVIHQSGIDQFTKSQFTFTDTGLTFADQTYYGPDGKPMSPRRDR